MKWDRFVISMVVSWSHSLTGLVSTRLIFLALYGVHAPEVDPGCNQKKWKPSVKFSSSGNTAINLNTYISFYTF